MFGGTLIEAVKYKVRPYCWTHQRLNKSWDGVSSVGMGTHGDQLCIQYKPHIQ